MIRTIGCLSVVALLSATVFGQGTGAQPAFESADVHTIPANGFGVSMAGGVLREGRYEIRGATMVDLVKTAYGVDDDKVVGGPSWLGTDRFDVIAQAPAGATAD